MIDHDRQYERSAIVRKTVAYVAVDEDANGYPVLERWSITKRRLAEQ